MRDINERERIERELSRRDSEIARDNANAAGSFALGIALISLVGIIIALFLFNRQAPVQQPTQAPAPQQPTQAPAQQPTAPNVNVQQQPPDINITVPTPVAPAPGGNLPNEPLPGGQVVPDAQVAPSAPVIPVEPVVPGAQEPLVPAPTQP